MAHRQVLRIKSRLSIAGESGRSSPVQYNLKILRWTAQSPIQSILNDWKQIYNSDSIQSYDDRPKYACLLGWSDACCCLQRLIRVKGLIKV
jgi:hypothetical protein